MDGIRQVIQMFRTDELEREVSYLKSKLEEYETEGIDYEKLWNDFEQEFGDSRLQHGTISCQLKYLMQSVENGMVKQEETK